MHLNPRSCPRRTSCRRITDAWYTAAELSASDSMWPVNRLRSSHGREGITAYTGGAPAPGSAAIPQFWMNLPQLYELLLAESEIGAEIAAITGAAPAGRLRDQFGVGPIMSRPSKNLSARGRIAQGARPYRVAGRAATRLIVRAALALARRSPRAPKPAALRPSPKRIFRGGGRCRQGQNRGP